MIPVSQAETILSRNTTRFPRIEKPLAQAYLSVLREFITADRDHPAGDLSQMDGFAISFAAWKKGYKSFKIAGVQKAGSLPRKSILPTSAFEIFTGALIPNGCDCVVPVEDVQVRDKNLFIPKRIRIKRGQFIRRQGSEYKKNDSLLHPGMVLNAPQIAVAAAAGKTKLLVAKTPTIAIIATGDELIPVSKSPQPFQSRESNIYSIAAALQKHGFDQNKMFHVKDNPAVIKKTFKKILKNFDVCLISGGISMGKFDFIPPILTELGARFLIHKVQQRPGKPFLFAKTSDGNPVFGLPGNPVSTLVCLYRYVLPYLAASCGAQPRPNLFLPLSQSFTKSNLTCFFPVKLKDNGLATLIPSQSSGDYFSWSKADGFVEIPAKKKFSKNNCARFFPW